MKTRFPLSLKFGLWLTLNLVVLFAILVGFLIAQGGLSGWLARPIGDRMQVIADALSVELNTTDAGVREDVMADYAERYGLRISLYENNGRLVAGEELDPPASVRARMGPPARVGRPPPPGGEEDDRGRRAPPGQRAGERIWMRAGEPTQWWAGARLPLHLGQDQRRPGVVLAVSDSTLAFGALLDLRPVVWTGVTALVVSVLFWTPLVVGMTRSLRAMMRATERIAEGRFETRVETVRGDEIGRLGESINQMAERLDVLVAGQKKFLADVAHELGSPVGRLQVGTSILEARVPTYLRPAVTDVREEVEQMSELLTELLAFTRADLSTPNAQLETVELSALVRGVVAREAAERAVVIEVDPDLRAQAEPALLSRAVANLVRNAVRHAGGEATIAVRARAAGNGRTQLWVQDDGPGVPAEALARLGEPFYRPDAARTREAGGVGLGLSIVRAAVQTMGASVDFKNRSPHGFEARITLRSA